MSWEYSSEFLLTETEQEQVSKQSARTVMSQFGGNFMSEWRVPSMLWRIRKDSTGLWVHTSMGMNNCQNNLCDIIPDIPRDWHCQRIRFPVICTKITRIKERKLQSEPVQPNPSAQ